MWKHAFQHLLLCEYVYMYVLLKTTQSIIWISIDDFEKFSLVLYFVFVIFVFFFNFNFYARTFSLILLVFSYFENFGSIFSYIYICIYQYTYTYVCIYICNNKSLFNAQSCILFVDISHSLPYSYLNCYSQSVTYICMYFYTNVCTYVCLLSLEFLPCKWIFVLETNVSSWQSAGGEWNKLMYVHMFEYYMYICIIYTHVWM